MAGVIGVDLGAVFSVVARITPGGKPRVVPNRDGRRKTRSAVLFGGGAPLVGRIAGSGGSGPGVAQFAGCSIGDPTWRFRAPDGRTFRSEEVAAIILKRLKQDAEQALGGEVTDAVLTVPACFDDASRQATADAGRIAGLTVRRLLNAPTAAALAYGPAIAAGSTVLVYALGGGVFDATVLRVGDRRVEVLATAGDRMLGGLDWDNVLMRQLNRSFRVAGGPDLLHDHATEAHLRDKAELAKLCLTSARHASVELSADGISRTVTVRRPEFEAATAGLLGRTRGIAQAALAGAGLTWSEIDRVLPAGGATRMPMVRTMLTRLSGRVAARPINPDEVVALGAAVAAHSDADPGDPWSAVPASDTPAVREVTSHALGTLARDPTTGARRNVVVIPANATLPATGRGVFATVAENQTRIDVEVTQGDDTDPAAVRRLACQTIRVPPHPAGAPIEIVYTYDVDHSPHLEAHDLTTGRPLGQFELRNLAAMSDAQLSQSVKKVNALPPS